MKRLATLVVMLSIVLTGVFAPAVHAIDLFGGCVQGTDCKVAKQNNLDYTGNNKVWSIIKQVLGVLAGIAVIMIVVGGIKYTISQGDSGAVTAAKNTIFYSVIGLIVALMSWAIVTFVVDWFK